MGDDRTPESIIVDHWFAVHPEQADPSWPTEARGVIAALEHAGRRIVDEDLLVRLTDAERLLATQARQDYRGPEPADRRAARRYFDRHPDAPERACPDSSLLAWGEHLVEEAGGG